MSPPKLAPNLVRAWAEGHGDPTVGKVIELWIETGQLPTGEPAPASALLGTLELVGVVRFS